MIQTISTTKEKNRMTAWARRALASGALIAALIAGGLQAPPAHAQETFTVDQTVDTPDLDVGDGDCDVSLAGIGFQCTLRAAIQEANATPEADLIRFFIQDAGGTGVKTISVGAAGFGKLPTITNPVTIDGYTQPGASPNTLAVGNDAALKIQLEGTNVSSANGLEINTSSGSVIRGLVINRFATGIKITGGSRGNHIEGNFIGTDPTGTLDRGNNFDGVTLFDGATLTVVGGTTPEARNLISGNDSTGIFLVSSDQNRIEGNYVGTDRSGTKALGNTDPGVFLNSASSNTIGGTTAASRNVISGNDSDGVHIVGNSWLNKVLGNRIGTTASGKGALGNTLAGVFIQSSTNLNFVGDGSPGAANKIAFNGEDGVDITGSASIGNVILRNSIFSNAGLGIDLGNDGVTANDGDDPNTPQVDPDSDTGPNNLQNKPVLTLAKTLSGKTTIKGKLNSRPDVDYKVGFFSNPSGNEGKTFIGEKIVTTDSSGNATFTFSPAKAVPVGQRITSTAMDSFLGDTSEFSAPRKAVAS